MILPIYTEPQPVLYQETKPIKEITPEIRQLVADMRETMHNGQGVGLAAPQVGHSLSLIVIEYQSEEPEERIPFLVLINPRITWRSLTTNVLIEGCLSLPGVEGPVRRPSRVRVKALDLDGHRIEISSSGYLGRIMQHEIDHLHGILFRQYVPNSKMMERKLVDYPVI
jgi:peptide deformylase